jgi:hypothetical protein
MKTLTATQRDDLRDDLVEARAHLRDAICLIENYVNQTGDRNAKAYLLDHLRIFADREHGFLTRDINIDDLIDRLDEVEENEEE